MTPAMILALAQAGTQVLAVVLQNINTGKVVLNATEMATLKGILDPLHADNMAASNKLDAMLAEAEKR